MLLNSGLRIFLLVLAPAFLGVSIDRNFNTRPSVSSLEPQVAALGELVAAHGANLDRSRVADLILASGDEKAITHIVEQAPDLIRFRVPLMLEPGDYRIVLVVDRRWGTEMIDQDVVLTVVGAYTAKL